LRWVNRKFFRGKIAVSSFFLPDSNYLGDSIAVVRKLVAILLLSLLVFNIGAYRLVITSLENKADSRLEATIDNNEYNDADLIEIRVAMNMPYQQRFTEFERHYGEVNINGKVYTYVKRKIDGDMLILKCIANSSKQELKKSSDDLAKSNSGQDQDNNGKKSAHSFAKTFSGDYDDKNQFCDLLIHNSFNRVLTARFASALSDPLTITPHQPPKC
jgi:hypothetical protein